MDLFTVSISNLYFYLDFMVRGGGLEPHTPKNAEGSEEYEVVDISKLKNTDK